jgi:two-component system chemotaxis response regulator CheY
MKRKGCRRLFFKTYEKLKLEQERFHMPKKILLVDDAPFMLMMLRDILTKNGFEIAGEALNGLEAVEMYKKLSPDLTLMDIGMPVCDGIEALKNIKEYDGSANVLMISALGQARTVVESLLYGANGFIGKPFGADKVLEEVRSALTKMKVYDKNKLEKVRDSIAPVKKEIEEKTGRITYAGGEILAQNEIDRFIMAAQSDASEEELTALIEEFSDNCRGHKAIPEADIEDDRLDSAPQADQILIISKLDQLIRGQEEILKLLREKPVGYLMEVTDK